MKKTLFLLILFLNFIFCNNEQEKMRLENENIIYHFENKNLTLEIYYLSLTSLSLRPLTVPMVREGFDYRITISSISIYKNKIIKILKSINLNNFIRTNIQQDTRIFYCFYDDNHNEVFSVSIGDCGDSMILNGKYEVNVKYFYDFISELLPEKVSFRYKDALIPVFQRLNELKLLKFEI